MERKLYLSKISYPQEKVPLWAIPSDEVYSVMKNGGIPKIMLPDFDYSLKRPRIAVILAQDQHPDRTEKDFSIFPDYVDAIIRAGGLPYFISYRKVEMQLTQIAPDGILLIGGNFRLVKNEAFKGYEERPQTYVNIIEYAAAKHLPTFAICGGEQMLAVYKGARVKTKINENLPKEESHLHPPYVLSHPVLLQEGSFIRRLLQTEKIMVNSCHNSAVDAAQTGECLVTGLAPDGVVEVIELQHPWHDFVLGVEWHPERTAKTGDEVSLRLFAAFIEACAETNKEFRVV